MPPSEKPQLPKIKDLIAGAKNTAFMPIHNLIAKAKEPKPGVMESLVDSYSRFRAARANNPKPSLEPIKDFVAKAFTGNVINYTASASNAVPQEQAPMTPPTPPTPPTSATTLPPLKFQESGTRSGLPYFDFGDKHVNIANMDWTPPPPAQRITKLEINDPRKGHSITYDDPKSLEMANTIKAVADAVAPHRTEYLLRLANYEGRFNPGARLYNFNKTYINDEGERVHYVSNNKEDAKKYGGIMSIDRGLFQINNKAFPSVPDHIADDPVKATLWAIAAIESGDGPSRWSSRPYVDKATSVIHY